MIIGLVQIIDIMFLLINIIYLYNINLRKKNPNRNLKKIESKRNLEIRNLEKLLYPDFYRPENK